MRAWNQRVRPTKPDGRPYTGDEPRCRCIRTSDSAVRPPEGPPPAATVAALASTAAIIYHFARL
jgi:hypothetical protein